MTYLILDTNTWIYLASGYDPMKGQHSEKVHSILLQRLIQKINSYEIVIIVPDLVIQEWDKNKKNTEVYLNELQRKISFNQDYFLSIQRFLTTENKKPLNNIHKDFEIGIKREIAKCKFRIDQVEEILKKNSIIVEIDDDIKAKVSDLAINKKAPFHHNKNSHADAAILLSIVKYLSDKVDGLQNNAIFVSNNSDDFCINKNDRRLHPDLSHLFDSVHLKLELHLGSALELSQKLTEDLEEALRAIKENSIECISEDCVNSEYFLGSRVILKSTYEIIIDKPYDPDQLVLEVGNENKPKPINKTFLITGDCNMCGSTHIKCPDCDCVFITQEIDIFDCPECGASLRTVEIGRNKFIRLLQ